MTMDEKSKRTQTLSKVTEAGKLEVHFKIEKEVA